MKTLNYISITVLAVFLGIGFISTNFAFAVSPATVNLGSADDFVILAKTGISTTGTTSIIGDIGVSPAAASYITGFGLVLPTGGKFATSTKITGKVYASDYAVPTPAKMTKAVSDMQIAYTNALGRTNPTSTELGAGNIGGMTLVAGLYKWSTDVTIPTDVTLSGSANDIWIFQIAQNLDISSAKKVILSGGAKADNVFWIVAGKTTLGTTSVFNGNILGKTAIVLNTGAKLNGRALAQSAVTLDANVVTISSGGNSIPNSSSDDDDDDEDDKDDKEENNDNDNNSNNKDPLVITNFGQAMKFVVGNLHIGSRGDFVKTLQAFLISQNPTNTSMKKYGTDGKFGPVTKAALVQWQSTHALVADGILGPKTKTKIKDLNL